MLVATQLAVNNASPCYLLLSIRERPNGFPFPPLAVEAELSTTIEFVLRIRCLARMHAMGLGAWRRQEARWRRKTSPER